MKRSPRHKKLAKLARQRRHARGGKRLIKVSYTTITPGEGEDYLGAGDYGEEHGWVDEEGSEITVDKYDRADGETIASKAAKFMKYDGAMEPSSSYYHRGVWYTTEGDTDYRTGENTQKSYHLYGFTNAEERAIFDLMTRRHR
jgi:hypothetical protein